MNTSLQNVEQNVVKESNFCSLEDYMWGKQEVSYTLNGLMTFFFLSLCVISSYNNHNLHFIKPQFLRIFSDSKISLLGSTISKYVA